MLILSYFSLVSVSSFGGMGIPIPFGLIGSGLSLSFSTAKSNRTQFNPQQHLSNEERTPPEARTTQDRPNQKDTTVIYRDGTLIRLVAERELFEIAVLAK